MLIGGPRAISFEAPTYMFTLSRNILIRRFSVWLCHHFRTRPVIVGVYIRRRYVRFRLFFSVAGNL